MVFMPPIPPRRSDWFQLGYPETRKDSTAVTGTSRLGRDQSSGINRARGDHAQRRHAGQEEIVSSAQFHKVRQSPANEWRVLWVFRSLDGVAAVPVMVAHQQVFVVAQMGIVAVFDPLLLHEL